MIEKPVERGPGLDGEPRTDEAWSEEMRQLVARLHGRLTRTLTEEEADQLTNELVEEVRQERNARDGRP